MKRMILKRLLALIPVLIGITVLVFVFMHLSETDAVDVMQANTGTVWSEQVQNVRREELGLNDPLIVQYLRWLGNFIRGDMGSSWISGIPIRTLLVEKLPATLLLAFLSLLISALVSIPAGIACAVHRDSPFDRIVSFFCVLFNASPQFFTALLLMYVFGVVLHLLPVISTGIHVQSIILPCLTLTLAVSAKFIRQIRTAVLDEMNRPYVQGAEARGIRRSHILMHHILPCILHTIITLFSLSFASLAGGSAVVETIFMWDGVGKMAVDAALNHDDPVIAAYVVWTAAICTLVSLLADILSQLTDPHMDEEEHS